MGAVFRAPLRTSLPGTAVVPSLDILGIDEHSLRARREKSDKNGIDEPDLGDL